MSKSSRMLSIIPLILLLPFIVDAKDCDEYYSCSACVNAPSWWSNCRWCPRDNKCHATGSVWPSNPCFFTENIKDDFFCSPPSGNYDPSLADKMLLLSSIAYDEVDVSTCARGLFGSDLQITAVATRKCNGPLGSVLPYDVHCSGFVGFSTQHQAIIVSFRGSNGFDQAGDILTSNLLKCAKDFRGMGNVQCYFDYAHETLWSALKLEVELLQACLPSYDIWVTGHSLGGAISSLASSSILLDNIASPDKLISYTFGMPRVGKKSYADSYSKLVKNRWRVTNMADFVTTFPNIVDLPGYDSPFHHGIEVYYHSGSSSGALAPHQQCNGYPLGEDPACSLLGRGSRLLITEPHTDYFGIHVGGHCSKFHVKERIGVWNPEFLANETTVYRVENGSYVKLHPHELQWRSTQCPSTSSSTPKTKTATGGDHKSGGSSKSGTQYTYYCLYLLLLIMVL